MKHPPILILLMLLTGTTLYAQEASFLHQITLDVVPDESESPTSSEPIALTTGPALKHGSGTQLGYNAMHQHTPFSMSLSAHAKDLSSIRSFSVYSTRGVSDRSFAPLRYVRDDQKGGVRQYLTRALGNNFERASPLDLYHLKRHATTNRLLSIGLHIWIISSGVILVFRGIASFTYGFWVRGIIYTTLGAILVGYGYSRVHH